MTDEIRTPRRSVLQTAARARPELAVMVVVGVALVILAALLPLTMAVDERTDRQRPLYDDAQTMAELQWAQFQRTGSAKALTVESGQTVVVADEDFTASPGVTLVVTATPDGYCIDGRNDLGDTTGDRCWDGNVNPAV